MPVSLSQLAQIGPISNFTDWQWRQLDQMYVLSASMIVFDYLSSSLGVYVTAVGNGVGPSYQLFPQSTAGSNIFFFANTTPYLFFIGAYLIGGGITNATAVNCTSPTWLLAFNTSTLSSWSGCGISFGSNSPFLEDIALDFQNQVAYFLFNLGGVLAIEIFQLTFTQLQSLIANQRYTGGYQLAYLQPPNTSSSTFISPAVMNFVYYNSTFYVGYSAGGNVFLWSIPLSAITFSTNFTASTQNVGTVYTIYSGGNGYFGSVFLNYYLSSGSVVYELLVYFITGSSSVTGDFGGTVDIYSFNLSSASATQLFVQSGIKAQLKAINFGGLVAFAFTEGGQFQVAVYDRKTNSFEYTSIPNGQIGGYVAQPYFAVGASGSPSSLTFTIYQILVDTTPVIQNLTYSNGTLSGTLVNANGGGALAGVTVYLYQLATEGDDYSSGTQIASTTTNSNGQFSFSISQPGYYAVKVIQSA